MAANQIKEKHSLMVRQEASRLGFACCGISKAAFLEDEAPRLERWLKSNMHGEMQYMENHFDKRLDPRLLVDGTKSVISLLMNYYPKETQKNHDAPKISKYAYGVDYHSVLKEKLKSLINFMSEHIGEVNGRAFVDSAPIMDKAWAVKGGLGWIGRHSNLIRKQKGSFFFIAELLVDIELEYDHPVRDYCGSCTACIDACPTNAIVAPHVVDGSKCISYFTIELKNAIPKEMVPILRNENWIFGCDICQDVCPWNSFSQAHSEPLFEPVPEILEMTKKQWEDISENVFEALFKESALKRAKIEGLKRNIRILK